MPGKTFRLSITLIHFIYNFWENLANFANKRDLFAVLISRVFFSSFLWLNSLKKTVRLQNNFLNYYFSTLLLFNSKFWGAICFMLQRCWLDVFRKSPRFVSKTAKTTGDFLRLPKNTSHCSKEGVGFGMLRIWNCIGWFYNIDLIKET